MKKILTILAALTICIALNLGLTNEAQAAELNPSIESGVELQEVRDHYRDHHNRHHRHPPPPWFRHRHHPPPPPDDWHGRDYPPPHRPPPPPPPGRHHRW